MVVRLLFATIVMDLQLTFFFVMTAFSYLQLGTKLKWPEFQTPGELTVQL